MKCHNVQLIEARLREAELALAEAPGPGLTTQLSRVVEEGRFALTQARPSWEVVGGSLSDDDIRPFKEAWACLPDWEYRSEDALSE